MLRSVVGCEAALDLSGTNRPGKDRAVNRRFMRIPEMGGVLGVDENGHQWVLRGRVMCPRGGLSRSLFRGIDENTQMLERSMDKEVGQVEGPTDFVKYALDRDNRKADSIFIKEVYFNIRPCTHQTVLIGDNIVYEVEMSQSPLWHEWHYIKHSLKKADPMGDKEVRCTCLPPLRSVARGLGITKFDMDRMDGLSGFRPSQPEMSIWRATENVVNEGPFIPTVNNKMEDDCLDAFVASVASHASKLPNVPTWNKPSQTQLPWVRNDEYLDSGDIALEQFEQVNESKKPEKTQEKAKPKKRRSLKRLFFAGARRLLYYIHGRKERNSAKN